MSREAGGVLVIVAGLALMIAAINGSLQRAWAQLVTPGEGTDGQVRAVGDVADGGDGSRVRAVGNTTEPPGDPRTFPNRFDFGGNYYLPPGYPGSGVRTATG
jgi:hypothetical protein